MRYQPAAWRSVVTQVRLPKEGQTSSAYEAAMLLQLSLTAAPCCHAAAALCKRSSNTTTRCICPQVCLMSYPLVKHLLGMLEVMEIPRLEVRLGGRSMAGGRAKRYEEQPATRIPTCAGKAACHWRAILTVPTVSLSHPTLGPAPEGPPRGSAARQGPRLALMHTHPTISIPPCRPPQAHRAVLQRAKERLLGRVAALDARRDKARLERLLAASFPYLGMADMREVRQGGRAGRRAGGLL